MMTKMKLTKKSLLTEGLTGGIFFILCILSFFNVPEILSVVSVFVCLFMLLIPIGVKMMCIDETDDEMCESHTIQAKAKVYDVLKYIFIVMIIVSKKLDPMFCLAIMLIVKSIVFRHYEKCGE